MSALAHIRPEPRHLFAAWRLDSTGHSMEVETTADTLDGIAAEVAHHCQRGEGFHVLVRDTVARTETLHIYRVKWSKGWAKCPDTLITKAVHVPKAELVAMMKVAGFVPVQRWAWGRGSDAVGAGDREIVL